MPARISLTCLALLLGVASCADDPEEDEETKELDLSNAWIAAEVPVLGGVDGPAGSRDFCFDLSHVGSVLTGAACADEETTGASRVCDPEGLRGGSVMLSNNTASWAFQIATQTGPTFIYDAVFDLPTTSTGPMMGTLAQSDDCAGAVCTLTLSRTSACP